MRGLVLSLFPGADLLGMAFEEAGFCVVRGPDCMMGGDIRNFHAVPGKFDGVIGGPPCKSFSKACTGQVATEGNLIPEFERVVLEAMPRWFCMENVEQAPMPFADRQPAVKVNGYLMQAHHYGAHQNRLRRFSTNLVLTPETGLVPVSQRHPDPWPTVTATENKYCGGTTDRRRAGRKVGRQMTLAEVNVAMGLPENWETPCLLNEYKYAVRGNGVPLPLGRAVARCVVDAIDSRSLAARLRKTSMFPPPWGVNDLLVAA